MKIVTILLLTIFTATASTNQFLQKLQAGLLEEEVNRNLDRAITIYSNLVSQADADRAMFANALFRLAETYRKSGNTNEAVATYQKLLAQYPDHHSLAILAQTNLSNFGISHTGIPKQENEEEIEIAQLEQMLKASPDLIYNGYQIYDAVDKDRRKVVNFLLNKNIPISGNPKVPVAPLHLAAFKGQLEMCGFLIDRGAEVNQKCRPVSFSDNSSKPGVQAIKSVFPRDPGVTPLHVAASQGYLQVSQLLIECGADAKATNRYGMTPLHYAAREGHLQVCQLLLDSGAVLDAKDKEGATALVYAVGRNAEGTVRFLLEKGSRPEEGTHNGFPLLAYVALRKPFDFLEILLSYKPNLDATSTLVTPLQALSSIGEIEGVTKLLEAGADPNKKGPNGATPLHSAIAYRRHPVDLDRIRLFLKYKADPNATDKNGSTPLHYALLRQDYESVKVLLENSANPIIKNNAGESPLDYVEHKKVTGQREPASNYEGTLLPSGTLPTYHEETTKLVVEAARKLQPARE